MALLQAHMKDEQSQGTQSSSTMTTALLQRTRVLQEENYELYQLLRVSETGQLKEEVRRRDDEYYTAAIEAHRIEARPTESKWPVSSSFVPVIKRIKARLRTSNAGSSVSAPYIRIPCQDLAV